ncbi:hypothetical protein [Niallia sp. 03133]|uniref:hypothetical protein n=1 Tax=Niallia sp. 03133 TaxID=3458060 RepID=UPI0040448359
MTYINPLFNEQKIIKEEAPKKTLPPSKPPRKISSDKTHNIKFPVNKIEQMKLKSLCKQVNRIHADVRKDPITQTKFNTAILRFGLLHLEIISWDKPYSDTKQYMHTNILESEYEEIGGPHGLSVRKNGSDRKIVYYIISSVLTWLEGEGNIEKVIKQL